MPGGFGIHSPVNRGKGDVPSRLANHNPGNPSRRGTPSSLGIHSLEDRSKRGIPSRSDIHSPAAPLSAADFVSFGMRWSSARKGLVALKRADAFPMSLP